MNTHLCGQLSRDMLSSQFQKAYFVRLCRHVVEIIFFIYYRGLYSVTTQVHIFTLNYVIPFHITAMQHHYQAWFIVGTVIKFNQEQWGNMSWDFLILKVNCTEQECQKRMHQSRETNKTSQPTWSQLSGLQYILHISLECCRVTSLNDYFYSWQHHFTNILFKITLEKCTKKKKKKKA